MAIVFPTVLLAVICVLYIIFFVHDMSKMRAAAYSTAITMDFEKKDISKIQESQLITFLYKSKSASVDRENSVSAKIKGVANIPFISVDRLFSSQKKVTCTAMVNTGMETDYLYVLKVVGDFVAEE